jgi:uncharacterized protein
MKVTLDVRLHMRSLSRFAATLALACACLVPFAVRAQEPTKAAIATAREVIITKGVGAMVDPLVHGVIESVKNNYLPTNPNLGRELTDVAAVLHKEFEAKRNDVIDVMARAYAKHFTEAELKDLLLFYKTPLGQKFAREEGAAIEEGFRGAKTWGDDFSETVMSRMRAEMQKKGHPL